MSKAKPRTVEHAESAKSRPFRRFVLRGLGVVMPPLLTLVLFIWAWATVDSYILKPIESGLSEVVVFFSMRSSVRNGIPSDVVPGQIWVLDANNQRVPNEAVMDWAGVVESIPTRARLRGWHVGSFVADGVTYVPVAGQKWIPREIYEQVEKNPGGLVLATATAREIYDRYVRMEHLQRWRTIPVFLIVFTALLYLLGRFLAAGVGRIFVTGFESLIHQLPLVRNVYSSVKQVTDLVFNEREIQFNRVVAVQYPRDGIWSLGFVTGESLLDISAAANEPVLAVLMPTSPMPATGFVITVRKSEILDLNLTLDQAIQFIVSCGVVVPPHQQRPGDLAAQLSATAARRLESKTSVAGDAVDS
ncbi:MAG: DUF502 domain-containing protein [Pirellulaceae bacterium]